ncbi:MAG: hypothetical protein IJD43_12540 [Thermoguttaceae bacterium]|nr:hypothetical protein [Thermoguttaceae bacterium]
MRDLDRFENRRSVAHSTAYRSSEPSDIPWAMVILRLFVVLLVVALFIWFALIIYRPTNIWVTQQEIDRMEQSVLTTRQEVERIRREKMIEVAEGKKLTPFEIIYNVSVDKNYVLTQEEREIVRKGWHDFLRNDTEVADPELLLFQMGMCYGENGAIVDIPQEEWEREKKIREMRAQDVSIRALIYRAVSEKEEISDDERAFIRAHWDQFLQEANISNPEELMFQLRIQYSESGKVVDIPMEEWEELKAQRDKERGEKSEEEVLADTMKEIALDVAERDQMIQSVRTGMQDRAKRKNYDARANRRMVKEAAMDFIESFGDQDDFFEEEDDETEASDGADPDDAENADDAETDQPAGTNEDEKQEAAENDPEAENAVSEDEPEDEPEAELKEEPEEGSEEGSEDAAESEKTDGAAENGKPNAAPIEESPEPEE